MDGAAVSICQPLPEPTHREATASLPCLLAPRASQAAGGGCGSLPCLGQLGVHQQPDARSKALLGAPNGRIGAGARCWWRALLGRLPSFLPWRWPQLYPSGLEKALCAQHATVLPGILCLSGQAVLSSLSSQQSLLRGRAAARKTAESGVSSRLSQASPFVAWSPWAGQRNGGGVLADDPCS